MSVTYNFLPVYVHNSMYDRHYVYGEQNVMCCNNSSVYRTLSQYQALLFTCIECAHIRMCYTSREDCVAKKPVPKSF